MSVASSQTTFLGLLQPGSSNDLYLCRGRFSTNEPIMQSIRDYCLNKSCIESQTRVALENTKIRGGKSWRHIRSTTQIGTAKRNIPPKTSTDTLDLYRAVVIP